MVSTLDNTSPSCNSGGMSGRALITGATGYVGGRLRRVLEERGVPVRCLARNAAYLSSRVSAATEVAEGDALDPAAVRRALDGIETVYYLIHALNAPAGFESDEYAAARNFAEGCRAAGVRRIVYLGGLAHPDPGKTTADLSPHMRSRLEVGAILRASGCEVIEFRASIIIGSGSLSFALIRALVEKLPVMITPRWVKCMAQPIGIADVLKYLAAAAELPPGESRVFEIGGREQASYQDIMQEYARQRGLRRWIIAVPVLTPALSSLWLGLVTPVYRRIGRKLIESVVHDSVVRDGSAREVFPFEPLSYREAIARALEREDRKFAETRWSDALSAIGPRPGYGGMRFGSRIIDTRSITVPVPPAAAFQPIASIGGANGWYCANILWRLRGLIDTFAGGPGYRRGRRHPRELYVGDALDFWRVERFERDALLRLHAEMRLPGRAWLQFEVLPVGTGSEIRQTAIFDPGGIAGLLYWYALYPLHAIIFRGMLHGIARRGCEAAAAG